MQNSNSDSARTANRRALLKGGAFAAAAAAAGAIGMSASPAAADFGDMDDGPITRGDAAILRFLAAAEIIESDLWQQYNELGGVSGGSAPYITALMVLDGDM